MNKFLIFTDARTGSISLSKIVSDLYKSKPTIPHKVVTEPFGKTGFGIYYPDLHRKLKPELAHLGEDSYKIPLKNIGKILDTCYQFSNGVKHIWSHLDVEDKFQNEFVLNYAIRNKIKIILLHREDFVLRAISLILSHQSEVWSVESPQERDRVEKAEYESVDIDGLEKIIKEYNHYLFRYRKLLEPFNYYDISYEDFFKVGYKGPDKRGEQMKEIDKICKFLGSNKKFLTEEVSSFSLSGERKQNTRVTYNKIPNIVEIIKYAEEKWDKDLSWILK